MNEKKTTGFVPEVHIFSLLTLWTLLLTGCLCAKIDASPRQQLRNNVSTLTITITLNLPPKWEDPGYGLRSLLLYSSPTLRLEPHARRSNGTFVTADAKLTQQQMLKLVDEIERVQMLRHASRFYSPVFDKPKTKRPPGRDYATYLAMRADKASCEINMTYREGDYYSIWVSTLPLGRKTEAMLNHIKPVVRGEEINALLVTNRYFQDNVK